MGFTRLNSVLREKKHENLDPLIKRAKRVDENHRESMARLPSHHSGFMGLQRLNQMGKSQADKYQQTNAKSP
uniref:Uncharacterized protein n=1 Tax=Romanomermis culicivorax TaxID=13658 RepID=A0A915IPY4_ROMCU